MKIYKLICNKWVEVTPSYEDTLLYWFFLYNDDLNVIGIGIV